MITADGPFFTWYARRFGATSVQCVNSVLSRARTRASRRSRRCAALRNVVRRARDDRRRVGRRPRLAASARATSSSPLSRAHLDFDELRRAGATRRSRRSSPAPHGSPAAVRAPTRNDTSSPLDAFALAAEDGCLQLRASFPGTTAEREHVVPVGTAEDDGVRPAVPGNAAASDVVAARRRLGAALFVAPAGPGVRCASTATIATAATPSASAPSAASSRSQTDAVLRHRSPPPAHAIRASAARRTTRARSTVRRARRASTTESAVDTGSTPGRSTPSAVMAKMPTRQRAAQARRREDAQPHEAEHEHGHLERKRDGEQQERRERVVVARANDDLEVRRVVVRQEVHGRRQDRASSRTRLPRRRARSRTRRARPSSAGAAPRTPARGTPTAARR